MLALLFEVGELRCALPCARIDEVLPLCPLERVPATHGAFCGLLSFRGDMVPVLDSGLLLAGIPSPRKLSTRLCVISAARRFALICAGAHDVQPLRPLASGALGASPHPLIARVMLAGERPVHCLDLDALSARSGQGRGEETRDGAGTTA